MIDIKVDDYEKLIHKMTHYFSWYGNLEDLYQAGFMGLMYARDKFDESYGTKFSTFAYSYILGEMKRLVREDKNIKVSRQILSLKLKIDKIVVLLSQKLMRPPTTKEIASSLGLDEEVVIQTLAIDTNTMSLDEPIQGLENEMSFYEIIDSKELDYNTLVALKEELTNLKEPDKTLIQKRFFEDYSQSEVAKILGMNQVSVSRIEKKVKEKLRRNLM